MVYYIDRIDLVKQIIFVIHCNPRLELLYDVHHLKCHFEDKTQM